MSGGLNAKLSKRTAFFGLKLWVVIGASVGMFIVLILCFLSIWVISRRKCRKTRGLLSLPKIPNVSKDIGVDRVGDQGCHDHPKSLLLTVFDKANKMISEKAPHRLGASRPSDPDNTSQCSSNCYYERGCSSNSGEEASSGTGRKQSSSSNVGNSAASPLVGLPEISHLGWGHWFTLRDLQFATRHFAAENVIGEGGYGVVYRGTLINGSEVAVKKLLNNLGQAEKEFRVEVEAIGHVRHKNLVRLLGYCIEGVHRMLVYECVNNGNLEEWLHGTAQGRGTLPWEARIKIMLGTAKALAYLHESIEPKVIHRDIKSSNILIDNAFNGKVSDFGLAKLMDAGESHITTRVMGTFGSVHITNCLDNKNYVAPEYANTGMLNEKSDVYSFGVLLLEAVTGREPVDYARPAIEVNLVEWLKMMVGTRRAEEVLDASLDVKPTTRALKRVLLVVLKCVDPDAEKRPKMSTVVQMLEVEDYPFREVISICFNHGRLEEISFKRNALHRRNRRSRTSSMEIESIKESTDMEGKAQQD